MIIVKNYGLIDTAFGIVIIEIVVRYLNLTEKGKRK